MSPLPPEFVGVWERVELVVDGRMIPDAGRSLWFQAGSQFLDVRAAGGGLQSEAFGGRTSWDPTTATLTWHHSINMHPDAPHDSGRVEWRDGDLIEHGTAEQLGDEIIYTEVWCRRSDPDTPVVIADRVGGIGRLAWCGAIGAVTIDDRPEGQLQGGIFTDRGWALVFDVVRGLPLPTEHERLPDASTSDELAHFCSRWVLSDCRSGFVGDTQ